MRAATVAAESCARVLSRASSASRLGGSTKIVTRSSRRLALTCCVPCQSMSVTMSRPYNDRRVDPVRAASP